MKRAGVLLPIFSLPGSIGIGDFGKSAYKWVDILSESGASLWQILPLNPVGYGNSPYQTYSSFAGDEIYICIEDLLLDNNIEFTVDIYTTDKVEYKKVRRIKRKYLKIAYKKFVKTKAYKDFLKRAYWLDEYVEFITLKNQNDNKSWTEWTDFNLNHSEMEFERFIQFIFDQQWHRLKTYTNNKGVEIVGDIPIYLGHDSAEVYFNQDLFHLNPNGKPYLVAGVPPDYFSEDGQLWGNPLYNWKKLAKDGYQMWVNRLSWNQSMFDVIRLDHFRAFDTYWAVSGTATTARDGEWLFGPGKDFFDKIFTEIPDLNIVVEDLGELRAEVHKLRDAYNLMGMRIVQFSLNDDEIEADKNISENLIAYTGTHDNEPIQAFVDNLSLKRKIELFIKLPKHSLSLSENIAYYCLSLNTRWAFLPIQDILIQSKDATINRPGTIGSPNWEYKLRNFNKVMAKMPNFKKMVYKTNRNL